MRCTALAASVSAVGMTWLYRSMVMDSCEWPRISITTRGGTRCASRSDAHVCRLSWSLMRLTPAWLDESRSRERTPSSRPR